MLLKVPVEIEVEVEVDISMGCKGARDSLGGVPNAGPPLEPDTPPEVDSVELMSVNLKELVEDKLNDIGDDEWFDMVNEEIQQGL